MSIKEPEGRGSSGGRRREGVHSGPRTNKNRSSRAGDGPKEREIEATMREAKKKKEGKPRARPKASKSQSGWRGKKKILPRRGPGTSE